MTTTLKNVNYTDAVNAFRLLAQPSNPLPFLHALADCIQEHGSDWVRTNEGKALLFPVLRMAYGSLFSLDSVSEFERLDKVIPRA